jgi:release factor glutamine methyltransferase
MESGSSNVSQLIRAGESYLVAHGVPNARRNAEWLLSHVLDCRSGDLYLDTRYIPAENQADAYDRLLRRRASREPLQYIVGMTEFMSLPFYSSPGVFIPRPDTEILVESLEPHLAGLDPIGDRRPMIDGLSASRFPRLGCDRLLADLCCGSGVIGVAIVKRVPGAKAVLVDSSAIAADLAAKNARLNGVEDRVECVCSDAVDFLGMTHVRFDAVICNPPYIPGDDIASLPPEINMHEPKASLDGGEHGLDFYCGIVSLLRPSLKSGGVVGFEVGVGQAESVCELLKSALLSDVRVHKDYAGIDRVVTARSV